MSKSIADLVDGLAAEGQPKSAAMVRYYITSRGIEPIEKVGSAKLYDDDVLDQLIEITAPKEKEEKPAKETKAAKKAPAKRRSKKAKADELDDLDDDLELEDA